MLWMKTAAGSTCHDGACEAASSLVHVGPSLTCSPVSMLCPGPAQPQHVCEDIWALLAGGVETQEAHCRVRAVARVPLDLRGLKDRIPWPPCPCEGVQPQCRTGAPGPLLGPVSSWGPEQPPQGTVDIAMFPCHTHTHTQTHTHSHIRVNSHAYTRTLIYPHIHSYTHIHTRVHRPTLPCRAVLLSIRPSLGGPLAQVTGQSFL